MHGLLFVLLPEARAFEQRWCELRSTPPYLVVHPHAPSPARPDGVDAKAWALMVAAQLHFVLGDGDTSGMDVARVLQQQGFAESPAAAADLGQSLVDAGVLAPAAGAGSVFGSFAADASRTFALCIEALPPGLVSVDLRDTRVAAEHSRPNATPRAHSLALQSPTGAETVLCSDSAQELESWRDALAVTVDGVRRRGQGMRPLSVQLAVEPDPTVEPRFADALAAAMLRASAADTSRAGYREVRQWVEADLGRRATAAERTAIKTVYMADEPVRVHALTPALLDATIACFTSVFTEDEPLTHSLGLSAADFGGAAEYICRAALTMPEGLSAVVTTMDDSVVAAFVLCMDFKGQFVCTRCHCGEHMPDACPVPACVLPILTLLAEAQSHFELEFRERQSRSAVPGEMLHVVAAGARRQFAGRHPVLRLYSSVADAARRHGFSAVVTEATSPAAQRLVRLFRVDDVAAVTFEVDYDQFSFDGRPVFQGVEPGSCELSHWRLPPKGSQLDRFHRAAVFALSHGHLLPAEDGGAFAHRLEALLAQACLGRCEAPFPFYSGADAQARWRAWRDVAALSASQARMQVLELLDGLSSSQDNLIGGWEQALVSGSLDSTRERWHRRAPEVPEPEPITFEPPESSSLGCLSCNTPVGDHEHEWHTLQQKVWFTTELELDPEVVLHVVAETGRGGGGGGGPSAAGTTASRSLFSVAVVLAHRFETGGRWLRSQSVRYQLRVHSGHFGRYWDVVRTHEELSLLLPEAPPVPDSDGAELTQHCHAVARALDALLADESPLASARVAGFLGLRATAPCRLATVVSLSRKGAPEEAADAAAAAAPAAGAASAADAGVEHLAQVAHAVRTALRQHASPDGWVSDLRLHFQRLDTDGNGLLDRGEFRAALTALEIGLTISDITRIAMVMDADGDGNISYQEFTDYLLAHEQGPSEDQQQQQQPEQPALTGFRPTDNPDPAQLRAAHELLCERSEAIAAKGANKFKAMTRQQARETAVRPPPFTPRGYLQKKGGVHKAWQRRYFRLDDGADAVGYFESMTATKAKGTIALAAIRRVVSLDTSVEMDFEVHTPSRVYVLRADDALTRLGWVRTLRTRAGLSSEDEEQVAEEPGRQSRASSSAPSAAGAADDDVPMSVTNMMGLDALFAQFAARLPKALAAQQHLQDQGAFYRDYASMQDLHEHVGAFAARWTSRFHDVLITELRRAIQLPVEQPELVAMLLQLVQQQHIEDKARQALECEVRLQGESKFGAVMREAAAGHKDSVEKTAKMLVQQLHMVVDDLVPLFPAEYDILGMFHRSLRRYMKEGVIAFLEQSGDQLEPVDVLRLLSQASTYRATLERIGLPDLGEFDSAERGLLFPYKARVRRLMGQWLRRILEQEMAALLTPDGLQTLGNGAFITSAPEDLMNSFTQQLQLNMAHLEGRSQQEVAVMLVGTLAEYHGPVMAMMKALARLKSEEEKGSPESQPQGEDPAAPAEEAEEQQQQQQQQPKKKPEDEAESTADLGARLARRAAGISLQAVCAVANNMCRIADELNTLQEDVCDDMEAEAGEQLAECLMDQASGFQMVATAALSVVIAMIEGDLEGMTSQLVAAPEWAESDHVVRCVEATVRDFFADLRLWLDDTAMFVKLVMLCQRRLVSVYVNALAHHGKRLGAAHVERVEGDMRVLEALFASYGPDVPESAVERLMRPLAAALQLLRATPESVAQLLPACAPLFGADDTRTLARALFRARADLPAADVAAAVRAIDATRLEACAHPMMALDAAPSAELSSMHRAHRSVGNVMSLLASMPGLPTEVDVFQYVYR